MSKKKGSKTPVSQIKLSPFRRAELPADLENRVRTLWEAVREGLLFNSFEQFEAAFLRDVAPESEIAVWERIVKQYQRYQTADMSPEERQSLMSRFLMESLLQSPLTIQKNDGDSGEKGPHAERGD